MKTCRVMHDNQAWYGVVEGDEIELLSAPPFGELSLTGMKLPVAGARLLTPCAPTKIVGIGLNYRAHAEEMKKPVPERPLLFIKPLTATLMPEAPIVLPFESSDVHHEAELGVVIGQRARRIGVDDARDVIFGYTCFVDVTARDIQRAEVQYTRAKGFDTFAPFGPFIETEVDPKNLTVVGRLNGEERQRGNTSDMVFDVYTLIAFISQSMTLLPGDVVTTGTPPGVGPMKDGDVFEVDIEGVGVLRNPVRREG